MAYFLDLERRNACKKDSNKAANDYDTEKNNVVNELTNKNENPKIAKQLVQTILVYSTVMEALLYKEQDLLRFVNNLVVISRLLLYVRAYGMP